MSKLINEIINMYNGLVTNPDSVRFSAGGNEFCFTDGTLYQVVDGQLLPGSKRVKSIKAVQNFVLLRS